ncbi:MAG: HAMP domain-containing histidine kinase [Clostridia bacterium]|nr:HAMP domain-containing histidine kinase [Clostridia bacterium]
MFILQLVFSLMLRYYYYDSVQNALESRAQLYRRTLELSAQTETVPWETRSRELIAYFTDKNKMELQVLSSSGRVLLSSTGFVPLAEPTVPDFQRAMTAPDGSGSWWGRNSAGEPVMALTMLETDKEGTLVGALRYVVSLAPVNRQIWTLIFLLFGFLLIIIFFVSLSGVYFINSIVTPVLDIGRTARRIAMGEYEARLEKQYNDEIGDLCDTINFMAGEIGAAEQMKNEFISSVSHELRTPLTAIKGWSETLLTAADDKELARQGLGVIGKEAQRLSGIVEELLDFSRMESGHMVLRQERLDVLAELEEAVFLFRDRAARAGVELAYCEVDHLPPVAGDGDRLKQVFINLLDNAVKYSRTGDRVRVEAAVLDEEIQVVISDTGIGISAEELPRIRQKFYQADAGVPGAGIGLALAEEIVRLHGGRLEIDSEQGVGTTVTVWLPCAAERNDYYGR